MSLEKSSILRTRGKGFVFELENSIHIYRNDIRLI